MSFLELAKRRYSCRKYDPRPVEAEKLEMILEAGRIAPSAVNFQPWHFYVIQSADDLAKLYQVYHREWFTTAPCVIVICGDHNQAWKRKEDGKDHCDIDVAITTDHMTLKATELELATCWICNFNVAKIRALLQLPDHMEPMVLLPVGYPLDSADPGRHGEKRKPLSEILSYGLPA
ncbi:MAG: nitroreductase family protein [Bacteroidales bacterium]|nr:nitroreductase family protein [Bacteroidales bacterium]